MSALYNKNQKTNVNCAEQSIGCLNEKLDVLDYLTDELALLWEDVSEDNYDENKISKILDEMEAIDPIKPFKEIGGNSR